MGVMEFINSLENRIDNDETKFEAYSDVHTKIANNVVMIDPMGYATYSFSDSDELLFPQIKIRILAKELHRRQKNSCRTVCNGYYENYLKKYLKPFDLHSNAFVAKVLNSSISYGIELLIEIKR